jgi:hypothetical protein
MSFVEVKDAKSGTLVARVPLSERDVSRLESVGRIRIQFRPCQDFSHHRLDGDGDVFSFDLTKTDAGVMTSSPQTARRYMDMRLGGYER